MDYAKRAIVVAPRSSPNFVTEASLNDYYVFSPLALHLAFNFSKPSVDT